MRTQIVKAAFFLTVAFVTGCSEHRILSTDPNLTSGSFRVIRNGPAFVLVDSSNDRKCIDAIAYGAVEEALEKSASRDTVVGVKYKRDNTLKIGSPTISISDDQAFVSSGAWLELGGERAFLQCSVDEVYRIVEI